MSPEKQGGGHMCPLKFQTCLNTVLGVRFSLFFYKEDKFYDLLFTFLHTKNIIWKWGYF